MVRNVNLKSMARSGLGWVFHDRQAMRKGPHRSQGKLQEVVHYPFFKLQVLPVHGITRGKFEE